MIYRISQIQKLFLQDA